MVAEQAPGPVVTISLYHDNQARVFETIRGDAGIDCRYRVTLWGGVSKRWHEPCVLDRESVPWSGCVMEVG